MSEQVARAELKTYMVMCIDPTSGEKPKFDSSDLELDSTHDSKQRELQVEQVEETQSSKVTLFTNDTASWLDEKKKHSNTNVLLSEQMAFSTDGDKLSALCTH